MHFAEIDGRRIEYRMLPGDAAAGPPLVFLHEGLGSVALWRDFPDKVARRLGAPALVYSRFGYGQSDGLIAPNTPRFMHDEALDVLPVLLDRLGIARPLLIGHSDGASIALIHAAASGRPVHGLVLMAPHVFVEPICLESIARIRDTYLTTDLRRASPSTMRTSTMPSSAGPTPGSCRSSRPGRSRICCPPCASRRC